MKSAAEIESLFSGLGAGFFLSAEEIRNRLSDVRAFVFDWDGVFNRGEKGPAATNTFSEPDSLGSNMLRYAFWRARGTFPICAIVSGANNATAEMFGKREHFHSVCCGYLDKTSAIEALESAHAIRRDEMAYVFDDVNDFSIAKDCALRFLVRRDASPLFREYAVTGGLIDYVTGAASGEYPVREISELLIGLLGDFSAVFESRQNFDSSYQEYFAARQQIETTIDNAK